MRGREDGRMNGWMCRGQKKSAGEPQLLGECVLSDDQSPLVQLKGLEELEK